VKIAARIETHSKVKTSPLKCRVAKSATQISTQLSGTQLSGYISVAFLQSALRVFRK